MKIAFRNTSLNKTSLAQLLTINSIIEEYQADGYRLTLRQLYYQLVSRDIIANQDKEYKKLSRILTEGRMAGIVDWDAIEDRLRQPYRPYYADSIKDALSDITRQYALDRQKGQEVYIEVWVEKDAISNVLKRVTEKYGINILVNRGYGSVSAMYDAYNRFSARLSNGATRGAVIYLGDHDPSGLDMIRDIGARIGEMLHHEDEDYSFGIEPIALTMEQIRKYNPPPNPAKKTDTRAYEYIKQHGGSSWEVDALNPKTLNKILTTAIEETIDMDVYNSVLDEEKADKETFNKFASTL